MMKKKYNILLVVLSVLVLCIKGTSNNYQLIHLKMKLEKNTEN